MVRRRVTIALVLLGVLAGTVGAAGCRPVAGPDPVAGPSTPTTTVGTPPPPTPGPTAGSATAGPPSGPPSSHPPAVPSSHPPASPSGCPQGDRQRLVEEYLAQLGGFGPVTVDGVQSAADCAAIVAFQRRYGISPAAGRAGPTTAEVARRLAATRTAACPAPAAGTTICVNLTLQTIWVLRAGRVVLGPTVTRTGMAGYATVTGSFQILNRNDREWSDPYQVWLPYWQRFHSGQGFHETTTYLHNSAIGSHGCVNLLHADAVALWRLAAVGTQVRIFGRRPGT